LVEQGDPNAQHNLAVMYYQGKGIKQDKQKAFYWYTKAAEQGEPKAQYNLATMYHQGDGIKQDIQKQQSKVIPTHNLI
jgi:FOG: TPR repeat, SEL1 subfamily